MNILSLEFLEWMKSALFIGFFVLAASYLLPKGILAFLQWKETKAYPKLVTALTFCIGAFFILIYLLSTLIVSHVKSMFGPIS